MAGGYTELLRLIQDREAVNAAVSNRATRELDANVRYLRELFETAILGENTISHARTVEIDAQIGQPVYFHATNARFERGLGGAEADTETGAIVTTASTQIVGIVKRKLNATSADILMFGLADIDLSQAIDGDIVPGLYYLSNVEAGHLVTSRPPVGVTVLQVMEDNGDGTHRVFVNPKFFDVLDAHKHYSFVLAAVPAGDHTPPISNQVHEITNADDSIEGWLPADHAVFDGHAPEGAAFGYNLSASVLGTLWPPLPVQSAYLELNRGEDKDLAGMAVPLGASGLCIMDNYGIWWLSDCYGDVPWPTDLNTSLGESVSESILECPRDLFMELKLYFSKPVFQTTGTAVLSLTAAEGSGLEITCLTDGQPANTGHLLINLDLDLRMGADDDLGYDVFKKLNDDGTIDHGPVVSSLKALTSNVTLSGGEVIDGRRYGDIDLSVDQDIEGHELAVDMVRLQGVTEEHYQDLLALGFAPSRNAEYRARLNVPATVPSGSLLKLRFRVMGRAAGAIPADVFLLTYRRLEQPSALLTPVAIVTSDTALAIDSEATLTAANQYIEIESDTFEVVGGDVVLFTLSRVNTDAYPAELHVLRQRGILVAGA